MKKYAFILLILIAVGAALAYKILTQEQRLDPTVFLQTTESIRNLQSLDKNLSVLLQRSRYDSEFDHDLLADTNYEISEEFDNLRFEALFEEIEASPALSEAVSQFEQQFFEREELLENYIDTSKEISLGITESSQASTDLQTLSENGDINRAYDDATIVIAATNAIIYKLAVGSIKQAIDSDTLLQRISDVQFQAPEELVSLLSLYKSGAARIFASHQRNSDALDSLLKQNTGGLLDQIENEYTGYHNKAISGSNTARNALILYGLLLLATLMFFAFKIRTNYLSLEQQVVDRTKEIESAYQELQESQEQLIQSEKMASLGEMVAGVAHEINTPLGYVSSNIETLSLNMTDLGEVLKGVEKIYYQAIDPQRDSKVISADLTETLRTFKRLEAAEIMGESEQLLGDGAYGLAEISKLVTGLKDFSRLDRQSSEHVDIHECIDNSLTIASNHIKENNVEIETEYQIIPEISCVPSKLNQLFLNVITNACQAMQADGGTLKVSTAHEDDNILIRFKDTGHGMNSETMQKMFDPFFTSKEIGKGTGLGLSIAYKIVTAHGGSIHAESEVGKGTEVHISLPVRGVAATANETPKDSERLDKINENQMVEEELVSKAS